MSRWPTISRAAISAPSRCTTSRASWRRWKPALFSWPPLQSRGARSASEWPPSAGFVRCASNPARVAFSSFCSRPNPVSPQADPVARGARGQVSFRECGARCRGGSPRGWYSWSIGEHFRRRTRLSPSTHVLDEHCRRSRCILVVVDDQDSFFEPVLSAAATSRALEWRDN